MKKLLICSILIACFFPSISHAQVDARCWLEQECYDARATYLKVESPKIGAAGWDKVFRQDDTTEQLCGGKEDAAKKQIGFCLPSTAAKTKISIGGITEFSGLAEFIAFVYKYGLSVASILAVLMIIYAGVQWTISGGNSEAISSAQHKITGAVIGLVILAAAYTILYTVNPDLVNLRPPNAWMINTQKIGAPNCSELETGNQISKTPSNKTGITLTTDQKKAGFSAISSDGWAPTSTAQCGNDYFVQSTGALTCTGSMCPTGKVCFNKNNTGNDCFEATIAGNIKNTSAEAALLLAAGGLVRTVFGEGWTYPWVANGSTKQLEIYMVCTNGTHEQIDITYPVDPGNASSNRPDKQQVYAVAASKKEIKEKWDNNCDGKGGPKGFILAVEFNESGDGAGLEEHFLGRALVQGSNETRTYKAFDLVNSSNDWDECILRNAPMQHFFTENELIQGITLDINAGAVEDIDDGEEEEKSKEVYYAGKKTLSGQSGVTGGTENCQ